MFFFPEILYDRYRDPLIQRPPSREYVRFNTSGLLTNVVSPSYVIPSDFDGHLQNLSVIATPGAAQNCTTLQLEMTPANQPATIISWYAASNGAVAADLVATHPTGLLVESGTSFLLRGLFNAGAASNNIRLSALLCLYPKMKY